MSRNANVPEHVPAAGQGQAKATLRRIEVNNPSESRRLTEGLPVTPTIRSPMLYPTELQARQVVSVHREARLSGAPKLTRPMPAQESRQKGSPHRPRSYDSMGSPAKPSAALRSRTRWSSTCYSITSSARSRSVWGIMSPIAFAVLRLMTNSNLDAWSTGSSAGFAPLRMRSTYEAARRNMAGVFVP